MASEQEPPPFRALIVEDHDLHRRAGIAALKRCGADPVREAASALEAIAAIAAEAHPFDILLCDLKLPGMDGLELLRRIAERRSASSVIIASSFDDSILRTAVIMARSYGLRILGAIEKPVTARKLNPLILRHFGRVFAKSAPAVTPMPVVEVREGIRARQLEPFYQPKIEIQTGACVGAEALMRWRHPELGIVSAAAFIPVMEEHGLIGEATLALIDLVIGQCREWSKDGFHVPVSINVSAGLLADTRLPSMFSQAVRSAGLEPSSFTVEVTETAAMTELGPSLETLARFRMKGFGLSIDDYGTGFSCMQQLVRIPFTEIKIDRVFVTGAGEQPVLMNLLDASLELARRLKLTSVAEGIESLADWQTLADLGCDLAQGYFIAPPMTGNALAEWHRGWSRTTVQPGTTRACLN